MDITIAIVILGLIVVGQMVERYLFAQKMLSQLSDATKAVMSRNISEYLAARESDKQPVKQSFAENDTVELSNASEEEFDRFIANEANFGAK